MSKTKQATDQPATDQPKPATVKRLTVLLPECPFRAKTARADWYAFCKANEGKTEAEVLELHKAKPVSYHVRGKLAGQPEDGAEWLDWLSSPKKQKGKPVVAFKE